MRPGLRSELRTATARVHEEAETQVDLRADIGTPQGYRTFLRVMLEVSTKFGASLDEAANLSGLEPRSEQLIEALSDDLGVGTSGQPRVWATPSPSSSYSIGVGYTLEGSSLGAAVLRKRIPDGVSTAYLDRLLSARRDRWVCYSRFLDDPSTDVSIDECVAGATDVFESVHVAIDSVAGHQSHWPPQTGSLPWEPQPNA